MLSIISCSIHPGLAENLKKNIEETIGDDTRYEFLIYDNRTERKPIAAVYNSCARKAAGDNLFFVHEDVAFLSKGWGKMIEEKLSEPDCGVIGFAGSIVKPAVYSGWAINPHCSRARYWRPDKDRKKLVCMNMPADVLFSPVVTLDGLGLFVKKTVHMNHRFDEKALTGFHCYDLDYSMEIARHYTNYCCNLDIYHMSRGNFGEEWLSYTIKIHNEKWSGFLPLTIPGATFSEDEIKRINDDALWKTFKSTYRTSFRTGKKIFSLYFRTLPMSAVHLKRTISGLLKLSRQMLTNMIRHS